MLVKNNNSITSKCAFALKYNGRKTEIRNDELEIKQTTESATSASCFDCFL